MTFRTVNTNDIKEGAERTDLYFPLIKGKRIGLVANTTSVIKRKYLLDTLLLAGMKFVKVFAPEHGFRVSTGAGE
ncbi:MAG: exo-beta-N-acetylmuramidase NamZ domain-containing protein, partial [Bacteroidota bacterium]